MQRPQSIRASAVAIALLVVSQIASSCSMPNESNSNPSIVQTSWATPTQVNAPQPNSNGAMVRANVHGTGVFVTKGVRQLTGLSWKVTANNGRSTTTSVIQNSVVYFGCAGRLYAVDTSTGTEKWNRELDNVAISAPAVVSNTVYVGVWEALYAINSDTGEVNWIYRLENGSDDTYYGDPVVYAGTVYFGGRKYFYALDSKTGREKWKVNLSATPPSVPTVYDGIIYVGTFTPDGTDSPYLYALDSETGQEKWKVKITGQGISGAVAATDRVVYAETWDDGLLALDASSGQEIWRYNTGSHLTGAPTVGYSTVYATNQGTLYALDSQTGKEKWKLQVGGGLYTDSVIADGIIYFGSSEISLGAVFAVFGGHGSGNLHAVDTNSRQELWKFSVDATISSAPAVENGIVYFGDDDGTLYAVK